MNIYNKDNKGLNILAWVTPEINVVKLNALFFLFVKVIIKEKIAHYIKCYW